MLLNTLCVYCGSNSGRLSVYLDGARTFGHTLAARNIGLVYGGAAIGVMGAVADAVMEAGGRAIGVIPESLMQKELAHRGLNELHVVQSMHQRKTMMAEKADGFVALPGGAGTLEEIFETWTWAQLGMHKKPCGLLNIAGYYDDLAHFLDHTVEESFMRAQHRAMLAIESDPSVLLDRLTHYEAPVVSKWIAPGEH